MKIIQIDFFQLKIYWTFLFIGLHEMRIFACDAIIAFRWILFFFCFLFYSPNTYFHNYSFRPAPGMSILLFTGNFSVLNLFCSNFFSHSVNASFKTNQKNPYQFKLELYERMKWTNIFLPMRIFCWFCRAVTPSISAWNLTLGAFDNKMPKSGQFPLTLSRFLGRSWGFVTIFYLVICPTHWCPFFIISSSIL